MVVSKSIFGISISVFKSISSSISFPVIKSFKGCLCSTSKIIDLTFGIETIVEIEGLAMKNGIGLIEEMPRGVPTKSKIERFPKIDVALSGTHIEISTVELTRIEVDVNNAKVKFFVELSNTLTIHDDAGVVGANSIAKEVTCNSVDEVLDTSIVDTWS